jgi:hypothetical protein
VWDTESILSVSYWIALKCKTLNCLQGWDTESLLSVKYWITLCFSDAKIKVIFVISMIYMFVFMWWLREDSTERNRFTLVNIIIRCDEVATWSREALVCFFLFFCCHFSKNTSDVAKMYFVLVVFFTFPKTKLL